MDGKRGTEQAGPRRPRTRRTVSKGVIPPVIANEGMPTPLPTSLLALAPLP
jgi:hypothetical protein